MAEGIEVRHQAGCASRDRRRCNCAPTYRGHAWDRLAKKRIRSQPFGSLAAARAWRADTLHALARARRVADAGPTITEAGAALVEGMASGAIRNRSGKRYKPSVVRSYREALALYVEPELGSRRLTEIRPRDIQAVVEQMAGRNFSPSTIRNAIVPLRVIFKRAVRHELIEVNPTGDLELPGMEKTPLRAVGRADVPVLLAALPEQDRALWATAIYGGLRRGELQALRVRDIDLVAKAIHIRDAWDEKARQFVGAKSEAGARAVPIPPQLEPYLVGHLRRPGGEDGLLFHRDRDAGHPFSSSTVLKRARRVWGKAGLLPLRIRLHEGRHTFGSFLAAAGLGPEVVKDLMGHSTITLAWDRYIHETPERHTETIRKLGEYLNGELLG